MNNDPDGAIWANGAVGWLQRALEVVWSHLVVYTWEGVDALYTCSPSQCDLSPIIIIVVVVSLSCFFQR